MVVIIFGRVCYVDDVVALLVGHRTCNSQVAASSPHRAPLQGCLPASYLHLCDQTHDLILVKGWLLCAAGKEIVGLASH